MCSNKMILNSKIIPLTIASICIVVGISILFVYQRLSYNVNPKWFEGLWNQFTTVEGLKDVYKVIIEMQILIIIGAGWSVWLVNKQFKAMVDANKNATNALELTERNTLLSYRPIGVFYSEVKDTEGVVTLEQGVQSYDFYAHTATMSICLKCVSKTGFLRLRGVLGGYSTTFLDRYTADDDLTESLQDAIHSIRIKTDEYLTEGLCNQAWHVEIDYPDGVSYRTNNNLLIIAFYDDIFGNMYGTALLHAYPTHPFPDGTDLVKLLAFNSDQRDRILDRIHANP